MKNTDAFQGFPNEIIDFFWELRFNNNREWFDNNRGRYLSLVKDPLHSFGMDVCLRLKETTGREFFYSVSRINRDIRFAKNKEPYRDHMWVVFKQDLGKWKDKPALFFEIGTDYYMVGMGIYEGLPLYMKAFRKSIDANTREFERLIKPFSKNNEFILYGDDYKKISQNEKSEQLYNWYRKKGISIIQTKEIDSLLYKRELIDFCCDGFKFLMPMMDYMTKVGGQIQ